MAIPTVAQRRGGPTEEEPVCQTSPASSSKRACFIPASTETNLALCVCSNGWATGTAGMICSQHGATPSWPASFAPLTKKRPEAQTNTVNDDPAAAAVIRTSSVRLGGCRRTSHRAQLGNGTSFTGPPSVGSCAGLDRKVSGTSTGTDRAKAGGNGRPQHPASLDPQAYAVPNSVTTTACRSPAAMIEMGIPPRTGEAGDGASAVSRRSEAVDPAPHPSTYRRVVRTRV